MLRWLSVKIRLLKVVRIPKVFFPRLAKLFATWYASRILVFFVVVVMRCAVKFFLFLGTKY